VPGAGLGSGIMRGGEYDGHVIHVDSDGILEMGTCRDAVMLLRRNDGKMRWARAFVSRQKFKDIRNGVLTRARAGAA
jgi:hypothetical protein